MRWLLLSVTFAFLFIAATLAYTFYEDPLSGFRSRQYEDEQLTSALWDTCRGNVTLPPLIDYWNYTCLDGGSGCISYDPLSRSLTKAVGKPRLLLISHTVASVWDSTNPLFPVRVAERSRDASGVSRFASGAAANNNFWYVAGTIYDYRSGDHSWTPCDRNYSIVALNVTTDAALTGARGNVWVTDKGTISKLAVYGNYLYAAACYGPYNGVDGGNIYIYEVSPSAPLNMILRRRIVTQPYGCTYDINVTTVGTQTYLYAVGNYTQLRVYNVTNANGTSLANYSIGFSGQAIQVKDNKAFVLGNQSFASFDVTNPFNIVTLDTADCMNALFQEPRSWVYDNSDPDCQHGVNETSHLSALVSAYGRTLFVRPVNNVTGPSSNGYVQLALFDVTNPSDVFFLGVTNKYVLYSPYIAGFVPYDETNLFTAISDGYMIQDRGSYLYDINPSTFLNYSQSGLAWSKNVVPSSSRKVEWANLTVNQTLLPNTAITFWLNNGGGATVWPLNTPLKFASPNQGYLTWQANLQQTTPPWVKTPVLDTLKIEYGACNTLAECTALNGNYCNRTVQEARTYTNDTPSCTCGIASVVPQSCADSRASCSAFGWQAVPLNCTVDSECASYFSGQKCLNSLPAPYGDSSSLALVDYSLASPATCNDEDRYSCQCNAPVVEGLCVPGMCGAECDRGSQCVDPVHDLCLNCFCIGNFWNDLGLNVIVYNASGDVGTHLVLKSDARDGDSVGGPLKYAWRNLTSLQGCVVDAGSWTSPDMGIQCSTVGDRFFTLQVNDTDVPYTMINSTEGVASFFAVPIATVPTVPVVVSTPEAGGGSALLLDCPRLAYEDSVSVTVQCLQNGVSCDSDDLRFEGGVATLSSQKNSVFVYRLETGVAKEYALSIFLMDTTAGVVIASASCSISRVDTVASASVPEFNWLFLPVLLLAALALLRVKRKKQAK